MYLRKEEEVVKLLNELNDKTIEVNTQTGSEQHGLGLDVSMRDFPPLRPSNRFMVLPNDDEGNGISVSALRGSTEEGVVPTVRLKTY